MRDCVFISYRRGDSRHPSSRIYDALRPKFGRSKLFMDIDSIRGGKEFPQVLEEALARSGVLIAIIGESWLTSKDAAGQRRLDDPLDFVRREIATGLRQKITVIPVLLDGALWLEAEELPDELKPLVTRNYISVRHETFSKDVSGLIEAVREALRPSPEVIRARNIKILRAAAAVAALVVIVAFPNLWLTPLRWVSATAQQIYADRRQSSVDARELSDRAAWQVAERQNTVPAYQTYLDLQRQGDMREEAARRIEDLKKQIAADEQRKEAELAEARKKQALDDANRRAQEEAARQAAEQAREDDAAFDVAVRLNDPGAFNIYLDGHPGGRHRLAAQSQLVLLELEASNKAEAMGWERARALNRLAEFQDYLNYWPSAQHAGEAQANIEKLLALSKRWDELKDAKAPRRLRQLLTDATGSEYAAMIKARLDEVAKADTADWAKAEAAQSGAAYRAYLDNWSEGEHRDEADERLDEIRKSADEWARIKGKSDAAALEAFLKRNYIADFESAARAELAALREQAREDDAAFDAAVRQNEASRFKDYLDRYAAGRHREAARAQLSTLELEAANKAEAAAWEHARALNTLVEYNRYLSLWPSGRRAGEAKQNVDRLAGLAKRWQDLQATKSLQSLRQLLADASGTEYAAAIQARVGELERADKADWAKTETALTKAAYLAYLSAWPEGDHREDANERLGEIERSAAEWARIQGRNDEAALEAFLKRPYVAEFESAARAELSALRAREEASRQAAEQAKQDDDAFDVAICLNEPGAFKAYLDEHPTGRHREEAQSRLAALGREAVRSAEAAAWERARSLNTLSEYREYLRVWASGDHAREAKQYIDRLTELAKRWRELKQAKNLGAPRQLLADAGGTEYEPMIEAFLVDIERAEKADWITADTTQTKAAYLAYLANWPDGDYRDDANERLSEIQKSAEEWDRIKGKNDEAALEAFLKRNYIADFAGAALAELVPLKKAHNEPLPVGVSLLTADAMARLIDGKTIGFLLSGAKITFGRTVRPPDKLKLRASYLQATTKQKFSLEGAFVADIDFEAHRLSIVGIGGVQESSVDKTGSLLLLQVLGADRTERDLATKDRLVLDPPDHQEQGRIPLHWHQMVLHARRKASAVRRALQHRVSRRRASDRDLTDL